MEVSVDTFLEYAAATNFWGKSWIDGEQILLHNHQEYCTIRNARKQSSPIQARGHPFLSEILLKPPRFPFRASRNAISSIPSAKPPLSIQTSFTAEVRPLNSWIVSSISAVKTPLSAMIDQQSRSFFPRAAA